MTTTSLLIAPISADRPEGNSGLTPFTFQLIRSGFLQRNSAVTLRVRGDGQDPTDQFDFQNNRFPWRRISFKPGEVSKRVTINIKGDATPEADETFLVALSNPTGLTISKASETAIVRDDDATSRTAVTISSISEDTGIANNFITSDTSLTISGGNDPLAAGERIQISSDGGSNWSDVSVSNQSWSFVDPTTHVDGVVNYQVRVINAFGRVGNTASQSVTIDTATPTAMVSVSSDSADKAEDPTGTTPFTFSINRTGNTSERSIVAWAVEASGINPVNGWDFEGDLLPSGEVVFAPGETSKQITVNVAQDNTLEPDETFHLTLTATEGATIDSSGSTARAVIRKGDSNGGWVFDWRDATSLNRTRGIRQAAITLPNLRSDDPPLSLVALRVDLSTPGINLTTTGKISDWQANSRETLTETTSGFITRSRSQGDSVVAAINTAFFTLTDSNRSVPTNLLGFAVKDGEVVSPALANFPATFLVDSITGARIQNITPTNASSLSGLKLATPGGPYQDGIILQNGMPQGDAIIQDARSALGLSRDNRFLTMLTVNRALKDSSPTYWGATMNDVGQILAGFGSYTGMNLDGGGSAQMAWWNPRRARAELLSTPLAAGERFVGSNLGVVYNP